MVSWRKARFVPLSEFCPRDERTMVCKLIAPLGSGLLDSRSTAVCLRSTVYIAHLSILVVSNCRQKYDLLLASRLTSPVRSDSLRKCHLPRPFPIRWISESAFLQLGFPRMHIPTPICRSCSKVVLNPFYKSIPGYRELLCKVYTLFRLFCCIRIDIKPRRGHNI
jgi:hypothetical protein